ncbi:MAG: ATP-binding protein [Firmicutes bacterium]|nr:ATP-binding protein [Bacillota bacterium]
MSHISQTYYNITPLLYFLYGQAFFIFGLAVANQNRRFSNPAMRKLLWLLAAFAVLHGLSEWGKLLILSEAGKISVNNLNSLEAANGILASVSYFLLLLFGLFFFLSTSNNPNLRILKYLPVVFLILACFFNTVYFFEEKRLIVGDILSRYFFCFPGSLFAGFAFYLKSQEYKLQRRYDVYRMQMGVSILFFLYYFFAGVIVPEGNIGFSESLNYTNFYNLAGFPIHIARAVLAVALFYCIGGMMEIFDRDYRQRMEEIKKRYFLMEERERIAEGLHDGVQQIFFSIGLESEAGVIKGSNSESAGHFKKILELSGRGISEVRDAIYSIYPRKEEGNFVQALKLLTDQMSTSKRANIEFDIQGEQVAIPLEMENVLFKIAHEAIYNSLKHSEAKNIKVSIIFGQDEIKLAVFDDGRGFDSSLFDNRKAKTGMGVHIMKKRITQVGGKIYVKSSPGKGTEVAANIPISR